MTMFVTGYEKLSSVFRLCPVIQSAADYRHLLLWLRNVFTVLTMMDYPYPTHFLADLPANPVNVRSALLHRVIVIIIILQLAPSFQCLVPLAANHHHHHHYHIDIYSAPITGCI